MATSYNPQASYSYAGGLGAAPSPVPIPQPAQDLANQIPGLSGLNKSASGFLGSELGGQLSPDTLAAIRNASATGAVNSGQPGSNAVTGTQAANASLANIGLTAQQLQSQGISDYSKFVPAVSGTQTTSPAIQAEVNTQNAIDAAAPNPYAAQSYAQQLFQQYLNQLNKPAQTPQTQANKAGLANDATYWSRPGSNQMIPGVNPT